MQPRYEWTGLGLLLLICFVAIALTAWQVEVDRSVFERFFGPINPVLAVATAAIIGAVALLHLQRHSEFAVLGPGDPGDAALVVARVVPLFAVVAICADLVFRYPEDVNVSMPDALRFYPAIAVFVEIALHAIPIALLTAILGMPTGIDATFWRIAIPIALIEAAFQAFHATSLTISLFNAIQLVAFGLAQVWMFWRFGFISMLGFRLVHYCLWHMVWGVARLRLLF